MPMKPSGGDSNEHTNKCEITTSYLPSHAPTPKTQMGPYTVPSPQFAPPYFEGAPKSDPIDMTRAC